MVSLQLVHTLFRHRYDCFDTELDELAEKLHGRVARWCLGAENSQRKKEFRKGTLILFV